MQRRLPAPLANRAAINSQLAHPQATFFVFKTRQSPITQLAWAQAVVGSLDKVFQLSS